MSPKFANESPLVQVVKTILRQQPEGLSIPEIRRALLQAGRPGVLESDIEKIVRLADFRRLPGGKIILQKMESATTDGENEPEGFARPDLPYTDYPSTLRDLPPLDTYVIFDVETNGLDPTTADFFQLSAITVINGRPKQSFNQYARVDTSTITRALRDKLHFDQLGLEEKIQSSGSQTQAIDSFLSFIGALPLVAHNATFDIAFLRKYVPDLPNCLIDSLELFLLAYPTARSHSIEPLATQFGLVKGGSRWGEVLSLDAALDVSSGLGVEPDDLFHSAIFDCLVLYILLQDGLVCLQRLHPRAKAYLGLLSSGLGGLINAQNAPSEEPTDLGEVITLIAWSDEISVILEDYKVPSPGLICDEPTALNQYHQLLSKLDWKPRIAQREMIKDVAGHFSHGTQAMIEAPTGTGKTIAYLIPALLQARATGEQVVVSTSTKTLQDQLQNDLDHRIQPYLSFNIRYAVLKGQDNYLCLTKLWNTFLEAFYGPNADETPFEEKLCLFYLIRFAEETQDGDLQNTSYWMQNRFPILAYLKSQLASERETCGSSCFYHQYCFFPRAKAFADRADLLIVNHTLLMLRHWDEDQYFNLVIDEAHNLEDVATNTLTEEASREEIEHLLTRLLRPDGRRGLLIRARRWVKEPALINHALGSVRRLRRRVREFGGYLREFVERQGVRFHPQYGVSWRMRVSPYRAHYFAWQHVDRAQKEILRELYDLNQTTREIMTELGEGENAALGRELSAIRARLFGLPEEPGQLTLLEDIPQVGYDPLVMVHWIELAVQGQSKDDEIQPEQITWAYKRAPVRVSDALEALVYQRTRAMVLTSATLTLADGGFNFYLDRLGLEPRISDDRLVQLPKEFNYAEQIMLAMPGYLKASARYDEIERFKESMASELDCLFRFTEGRGLVLHTARTRMEYVASHLEQSLTQLPIYWQSEGASTRLLKEEFETREESVLLGLRSFWEGIDVPGPSLSYLVIEKLPFPVPTDPIIEARREQIVSQGGNEWMDYLIPLATLHFKQGFGRLMRRHEDRGVVIFMDKRLRGDTFYRESVLGSLPGYKRTDDAIEAEESRIELYQAIADHMRPVFPEWNWEDRLDLFPCIREEAIPDLERLIRELELPHRIPKAEYTSYRDRLVRVAMELIQDFKDFRPEQDQAMSSILSGQDTLVVLPTGSGKSLTFQLPAFLRNGVTLVFSPLIALMRDQVDKLRGSGLTLVDYIVSGQSGAHRDEVYRRMTRGELRLVYIAPERIRDPALGEALQNSNVIQVVVDEAHCVHMWGHSFRPDFLNIPNLFPEERPPIVALTATATETTREGITKALNLHSKVNLITKSVDRPELKFAVYNQSSAPERINNKPDKMRVLIKILRAAQRKDETVIIYTSTVREAEQITRLLNMHGFTVRHYHGRMTSRDREDVQELFREGIVKIIVATKAFGLGIDKSDVRYVIHYNIPGDLESYFQEAGRAGRDGETAYSILLYHKSDLSTQQYFIHSAFPENEELNSIAQVLRIRASVNGDRQILVNPEELAEEAGVDVEDLGVILHMLESLGFIRRSFNFTLNANLLLNRSPEWLYDKLSSTQAGLLKKLVSKAGVSDKRGIQLDVLGISRELDVDPLELDQIFTQLSSRGWAVYRPWDRGYTLYAESKLIDGSQAQLSKVDVNRLQSSMWSNLKRIMYYGETLGSGDCRRAYILKHFDETLQERPEHCCDLCNPNMPFPWREIPHEDVVGLPIEVDPAYLTLRAIEWNQDRFAKGFSPYSTRILSLILSGNTYAATQYIEDPSQKRQRIKRLESSPYFGVLQNVKGKDKAIQRILDRLLEEDYAQLEPITFDTTEEGEITYTAPMLTSKGKSQVHSGKYFNLEIQPSRT